MVPAHDKDASEIIIATVTVDHDSEYHFTLCLRSICSRSPAQLEARSMSPVETFSSRAERQVLTRSPPSPCLARSRISIYLTSHVVQSVFGREPDSRTFLSHAFNFEWHSSEHRTGGFGASSGESARAPWAFVNAVPARDLSCHLHVCAT